MYVKYTKIKAITKRPKDDSKIIISFLKTGFSLPISKIS
jgi:hypothetical protein